MGIWPEYNLNVHNPYFKNWLATISENKSDVSVVSSSQPITDSAGRGGGGRGGGLVIETKRRLILQTNENMDGERYHQDNRKWHGSSVGGYTSAHSRFFLSFLGNIDVTSPGMRFSRWARASLTSPPGVVSKKKKKINKNISCFSSVSLSLFTHAPNPPFVWPPVSVLILRKYGCFVFRNHLMLEVRETVRSRAKQWLKCP